MSKRRAPGPAKKRTPAKKTKRTGRQRALRAAKWLGILGLVGAGLAVAAFVVLYQAISIPEPNEDFEAQTTFVYYAGGEQEVGRYAEQNRISIPLDEMPQTMRDAVVAAENRSFWTDQGIDPKGILRAAFSNARGNSTQGASTITQQYVKILYLTSERSLTRKVKEAIVSLKLQRQQSKEEILEGYLNTIYFGRGAYGVEAAANAFFDKPASELSLRESAVLACVLNNPSQFDPAGGRDARAALRDRYAYVLDGMAEMGTVSAEQAERAEKRLPRFPEIRAESTYGGQRGHMLKLVKDELVELGFTEQEIEGGGLRITTTFTPTAMSAAQEGVISARPEGFGDKQLHVGAASVEVGTGALRGFYGGQDYLDSQINWAVAGGQAGSTMKVAALTAAIKDGFELTDTFEGNSPYVLPDGTDVENQGDSSYGSAISMITATENSVNTAFIDMTLGMENGAQKVVRAANELGIPPRRPATPAFGIPTTSPGLEPLTGVSLGNATVSPINVANAYATVASGGDRSDVHVIERVVDRFGEERYAFQASTQQAMSADIASDVSYALQQVVSAGSGTAALGLGRPAAGKTGTATNGLGEVSSAWFAGYTPQMSTAVMYVRGKGNEQLEGWLPSYFGGAYPAETWTAIMTPLMADREVEDFPEPAYVDGEAPSEGHEYTPPPSPTERPSPTRRPTRQTEEPTPTEPTTLPPTTLPPTTLPPTVPPTTVLPPPTTPPPTVPPPTTPPPATPVVPPSAPPATATAPPARPVPRPTSWSTPDARA